MIHTDVIIVGCGPAGISCALELRKNNIDVTILESKDSLKGKVCGDGLTVRALGDLYYNFRLDPTCLEGKKVYRKVVSKNGLVDEKRFIDFLSFEYEFGVSRDLLDKYMLDGAIKYGAKVIFNEKVNHIEAGDGGYIVNEKYSCKKVVLACGAIGGNQLGGFAKPDDLPVGMSARIIGDCDYVPDAFYYFYDEKYGDGYAWIFPVGENVWNIGVWSSSRKDIRQLYEEFEQIVFPGEKQYDRLPKGALIGATNKVISKDSDFICIGDCAYKADFYSGEGVSFAIEDGIEAARSICDCI